VGCLVMKGGWQREEALPVLCSEVVQVGLGGERVCVFGGWGLRVGWWERSCALELGGCFQCVLS